MCNGNCKICRFCGDKYNCGSSISCAHCGVSTCGDDCIYTCQKCKRWICENCKCETCELDVLAPGESIWDSSDYPEYYDSFDSDLDSSDSSDY